MLLVSKFKLLSSIGISSVSLASVPTAVCLSASKSTAEFLQPINTTKKTVKQFVKDSFVGFDKSLERQYTDFGGQVVGNIKESPTKTQEQLKVMQELTKATAGTVKDNSEDINYYLFLAGDIVKALIKYTPVIIKDTVVGFTPGGATKQLFGVQKIMEIIKSPKMVSVIAGLMAVAKDHSGKLEEMTQKDAGAILKIFKEVQTGNIGDENSPISQLLQQIGQNAMTIKSDDSFCNSTKLMIRLMIGDQTKLDAMKNTMQEISTLLETMKPLLGTIEGMDDDQVDSTKTVLDGLKDQSSLGDPCDSSSQDS